MFVARVIGRLLRRLLVGGVKLLVQHPISSVIIVVLLAIIYFLGSNPTAARGDMAGQTGVVSSSLLATNAARPLGPEQWLQGYKEFNAQLVWDSMGEEMKQGLESQGGSVQSLQQQFDEARMAGNTLVGSEYVGRYLADDGHTIHFYVVFLRDGSSGQTAHVPFTFITDTNGKLLRVE
mgnify:CR=1 FL=1